MTAQQQTKTSKFLSLVLRHEPGKIGLRLDDAGWARVDELLQQLAKHNHPLSPAALAEVVRSCPKQRFAFSEDGTRIRASQGHSVGVDLQLQAHTPPEILYHGTVAAALDSIRSQGLRPMSRHHVHLSADVDTATTVGKRRGQPIILTVRSGAVHRAGALFYQSENGVWLTDAVPPEYLDIPQTAETP